MDEVPDLLDLRGRLARGALIFAIAAIPAVCVGTTDVGRGDLNACWVPWFFASVVFVTVAVLLHRWLDPLAIAMNRHEPPVRIPSARVIRRARAKAIASEPS